MYLAPPFFFFFTFAFLFFSLVLLLYVLTVATYIFVCMCTRTYSKRIMCPGTPRQTHGQPTSHCALVAWLSVNAAGRKAAKTGASWDSCKRWSDATRA